MPMMLTRTSMLTGITRTREIDCTPLQLNEYETGRRLLQHCFPHLHADEREFIKTGITPEEWDDAFDPDNEWED